MNLKKLFFVTLAIALLLVSCKVKKQNSVDLSVPEVKTVNYTTVPDITENDIHWHISVLASDSMRGRGSGTSDEALAAEYIKDKFTALGLKPFNDNYLQKFPVYTRKFFSNCELYFDDYKAEYPEDFRSMIMFDSLTVTGEVILTEYDKDFEKLDVKGKWVMIRENANSILYERKAAAKARGAVGMLAVGIDGTTGGERYVLASDSVPLIKISNKLYDRLLDHTGVVVTATIKSATQQISSQNVVACLESNNPEYKDSYIVIGAHYDHIGTIMKGDSLLINYGADDNASGTAGLLEIAEKLRTYKELKYNIIFTAFGAEELGLFGSRFFCDNPPVPLEKIKLMVNMDMIGRMDSDNHAYINTIEPNDKLNALVDVIKNSHPDVNAVISSDSHFRSTDHYSFYNKKIPVISFITGLHKDYHTPSDTMGKINFGGEKQLLDFIYDLVISPATDDCIRSFTSSGVNP